MLRVINCVKTCEKSREKAVRKITQAVKKVFGLLKIGVRFFTKECSVEKFYRWIFAFGFVRFTSDWRKVLHIFHIAYYYY